MTIFRQHLDANYTVIPNEPLRDKNLSWRAKGLLVYLLSLPQDWNVRMSHLSTEATDGKTAVSTIMAELEDAGYVRRRSVSRGGDGNLMTTITDVRAQLGFPWQDDPQPAKKRTKKVDGRTPGDRDPEARDSDRRDPDAKDLQSNEHEVPSNKVMRDEPSAGAERAPSPPPSGSIVKPTSTGIAGVTPTARETAREVTKAYWEWYQRQHGADPSPKWIAIQNGVETLLSKGWPIPTIKQALVNAPNVSVPTLTLECQRIRGTATNSRRPSGGSISDVDAVVAAMQAEEERRAAAQESSDDPPPGVIDADSWEVA